MALVSKIIGDCPACGRKDGYGNVSVGGHTLVRGCLSCRHFDRIPLPDLNKTVLYLDQYFYSHAFRGGNKLFVEAKERIQELAHKQLLVAPYSNIHEDETHLWTPEQSEPLWKFIKQTSAGVHFAAEYDVKARQLHRAFGSFLKGAPPDHSIEPEDALPADLDKWNDYVWVDVGRFRVDPAAIRDGKVASVNQLLDLFPGWASTPSTFKDDVRVELRAGARAYLELYFKYIQRMANGDPSTMFDSPIDSQVVERLLRYDRELSPVEQLKRIGSFFGSEHYANVPVERISSEFFALLRHRLREGAFKARHKAQKHFKGFFYDVRFISTYAPYCDAMVVDSLMHRWATDPLIDLPGRFGTRFFSRDNWSEFRAYLDDIANNMTAELAQALKSVHPPNAKAPDWSAVLAQLR